MKEDPCQDMLLWYFGSPKDNDLKSGGREKKREKEKGG